MRRCILVLALAFYCCAPAIAYDWHLGIEAAITEDTNLQSRIDFHVNEFAFEFTARQTDYAEVEAMNGTLEWIRNYRITDPTLVYSTGLQWQASMYYSAFPQHGPVAGYTRISDVDETFFVGWRAEFGSW